MGESEHSQATESYAIIDGPCKLIHNKARPPDREELQRLRSLVYVR